MKFIFIDTFALADFTKDHFDDLKKFLLNSELYVVISSLQLVEYFSPERAENDRIDRAVRLFTHVPFVLINQSDVYGREEEHYPESLGELPFRLDGAQLFRNFTPEDRAALLLRMFHEGIPEGDFHLREWTAEHRSQTDWPEHVRLIIENATMKGTIASKAGMLQSLDLRFCHGMLAALEKLGQPALHDAAFRKNLNKLSLVNQNQDSWKMRGIHLSSLIFWYDYIIAKKQVKPSDDADILHAMIFPYCDIVVVDNSRADCLDKIQRNESLYEKFKCYNKKSFTRLLLQGL